MSKLKSLAGQTAVYGFSSIVSKVLNYFLTPLYTAIFARDLYGVISEMYAYIAVVLALLTFGMETSLFNFSRKHPLKDVVFSTSQLFVGGLSLLFLGFVVVFAEPIAQLLRHPNHKEYVMLFSLIIVLDALAAVPMAKLREMNKAGIFAIINIINILIFIGANLFFFVYCRNHYLQHGENSNWIVNTFYNPQIGVAYVFICNILASGSKLLLLIPVMLRGKFKMNWGLLREMLYYASPLALGALCFIINEKTDLIFLKYILPADIAMKEVGVYSACYKLAIFMTIFIQAFRFAAEPFFFTLEKEKGAERVYADVMKYFVIFCLGIFLIVTLFIDLFKHFLQQSEYWEALGIVPILLAANLFSGIYQNLSMWYKLSGETKFGMYFSLLGAGITIVLNILLIPFLGYFGSAWATFICYFVMMVVSYYIGQKHYKIPYNLKELFGYGILALVLYLAFAQFHPENYTGKMIYSGVLFSVFLGFVLIRENKFLLKIVKKQS